MSAVPLAVVSKSEGKAEAKADTPATAATRGCPNGPSCREPCCIMPAMTPSDEDSPKWVQRKRVLEALEEEDGKVLFSSPAHPWKVGTNSGATPSSYASSSFSPSDDPEAHQYGGSTPVSRRLWSRPGRIHPRGRQEPPPQMNCWQLGVRIGMDGWSFEADLGVCVVGYSRRLEHIRYARTPTRSVDPVI